eukprot:SAG31_NODE_18_length_35375_cov_22.525315_15_plen_69_part_00
MTLDEDPLTNDFGGILNFSSAVVSACSATSRSATNILHGNKNDDVEDEESHYTKGDTENEAVSNFCEL